MTKKHVFLLILAAVTLTLLLSGCSKGGEDLDGKYIATFELNGGTLDLKSFDVSSKINYAYDPGAYILDPATFGNYEILRSGYRFTGWYTHEDCREEDKWDFATDTINQERLTLYAGWERETVYTFTVCYVDGNNTVTLGQYNVDEGRAFEDYRKYAQKRENYTVVGYFADADCTLPWDFNRVHPGGDSDTDIPVYVDYIPGEWKVVDSYQTLLSAIGTGNIYLAADIDCDGQALSFSGTFRYVFEGNGYTVSNFVVNKAGGALMPSASIFDTLGAGSEIRHVAFENVTFNFFDVDRASKLKVAALAKEAAGCIVSDVSVTGKIVTNYEGEFPRLNQAFYEESSTGEVTGFTAEITVGRL